MPLLGADKLRCGQFLQRSVNRARSGTGVKAGRRVSVWSLGSFGRGGRGCVGWGCVVRSSWWCCHLACGRGHFGAEAQRSDNFVFLMSVSD